MIETGRGRSLWVILGCGYDSSPEVARVGRPVPRSGWGWVVGTGFRRSAGGGQGAQAGEGVDEQCGPGCVRGQACVPQLS